MAGDCGSCTLCCTLMRVHVPDQFEKPAMRACPHLGCNGCAIYATRPDPCVGFQCVWLVSQQKPGLALPNCERPDRTGIVLEVNSKSTVIAHCQTPEAWKRPVNLKRLMQLNRTTSVTIEHGGGRVSVLEKDGTITDMVHIGDAPNGEKKYVRRPELAAYYRDLREGKIHD